MSPAEPAKPSLTGLKDGQRFVLKQRLGSHTRHSVRLVHVGSDPQAGIVFEQLIDVFRYVNWQIQTAEIGAVFASGVNFPHGPYLTGSNIDAPIVELVLSTFAAVGIDLPLIPNAYMGPTSLGAPTDVVIVIQ